MIRTALLILILFSTLAFQTHSQSTTWVGPDNGDWNNDSNWSSGEVPGTGEEVIINSGDVNISTSPNPVIGSLTMTGGTLELFLGLSLTINGNSTVGSGAALQKRGTLNLNDNLTIEGTLIIEDSGIFGTGDLIINGNLDWNGGAATVNHTGQFLNNGTINIVSAQLKTTLDNQGTIEQHGTFTIHDNGRYINNGMHDIQGNGDINEDGANFGFTNNGTLIKSAGTSRSDIQPVYDGSGSVEAQMGTIDFRGPSTQSGTLISSGGSVRFPTFTHSFSGVSIQGDGFTEVNGATVTMDSDVSATNLTLNGGEISGAGNLTVSGTTNWMTGTFGNSVDAGQVILLGDFIIDGPNGKFLGTTLTNNGAATWIDGNWVLHTGSHFINEGAFDIQTSHDMGSEGMVQNNGTWTRTLGTSTTSINSPFTNTGTISVETGAIEFKDNSTQSGILTSSGGPVQFGLGPIQFISGAHSFSGTTIEGDGAVEFKGGTVTLTTNVSASNIILSGGTIGGTGDLTVSGTTNWITGTFGNSVDLGEIILLGDFIIDGSGGKFLGTTLTNNSAATWIDGNWVLNTGAQFINEGVFDIQTNDDMGTGGMIINNGTWTKSSGTFTTFINTTFANNGSISVETGEFRLFNGSNTGTITTTSGATLDFSGSSSTFTNESGGTIGGTGAITIGGSLVNNGNMSPGASPGILTIPSAANLTFGSTSIIDMEIGGTTVGTEYDQMDLTGTFALDGTLNVTLINSFDLSIGDSFELIKYTNHTGQFGTISLPTIAGLALDVADENGLIKLSVSEENIAPVLDNSADLQFTAIDEDDTDSSGDLISGIETGTGITLITDTNGPQEGIAVSAVDDTNGAWQYSLDNGTSWTDFGSPSTTAARLLLRDSNTKVRFVTTANFNGTINSGITFHAWDQWLGAVNGSTADITSTGGITPFSTESETISITVNAINDSPTLSNAVADQQTNEDEVFSLSVPANTFEDIDAGDMLSLGATLSDNTPLPNWLTFDGSNFSGTPTNDDIGTITIQLTATDNSSASISDQFDLDVINVNDAPILENPIDDQNIEGGKAFSFSFSENTFSDVDANDALTYSAILSNDNILPDWLSFDSNTRTFSGTPENAEASYTIKVVATDIDQATTTDEFVLNVSFILSIQDEDERLKIMTIPNPFIDQYLLKLENAPIGEIGIEIFDSVGRRVYVDSFQNNDINYDQHIDLSNQLSGIYILNITHSKGSPSSRIVKR